MAPLFHTEIFVFLFVLEVSSKPRKTRAVLYKYTPFTRSPQQKEYFTSCLCPCMLCHPSLKSSGDFCVESVWVENIFFSCVKGNSRVSGPNFADIHLVHVWKLWWHPPTKLRSSDPGLLIVPRACLKRKAWLCQWSVSFLSMTSFFSSFFKGFLFFPSSSRVWVSKQRGALSPCI